MKKIVTIALNVFYAKKDKDFECILEKIDRCKNYSDNSSTTKETKHIASGFSMSTMSLFRRIENKHDVYSSGVCMKLCESLRKLAMRIINFKTKKVSY